MEIMNAVSTEFLLLVGIAISGAAFLWKIQRTLTADISGLREEVKSDISGLREEVKSDISGLREEVKSDISGLRKEVNSLAQRVAKIEGLLMPTPNITHPQNTEQP